MGKWITGHKLLEKWKVSQYDLAELILNDELNAYFPNDLTSVNESFKKYIKETIYERKRRGIYSIARAVGMLNQEVDSETLGFQREIVPTIVEGVLEFLFVRSEVEEYARTHGWTAEELGPSTPDSPAPAPAPAAPPAPVVAISPSDHIMRRREEGVNVNIIALELHDRTGNFQLTYLEICRKLDLGKGIHLSIDALKKRGERACIRGKAMLTKNGKRKKS